eukprot:3525194-Pleurochrysis_carterae.AAC.2
MEHCRKQFPGRTQARTFGSSWIMDWTTPISEKLVRPTCHGEVCSMMSLVRTKASGGCDLGSSASRRGRPRGNFSGLLMPINAYGLIVSPLPGSAEGRGACLL